MKESISPEELFTTFNRRRESLLLLKHYYELAIQSDEPVLGESSDFEAIQALQSLDDERLIEEHLQIKKQLEALEVISNQMQLALFRKANTLAALEEMSEKLRVLSALRKSTVFLNRFLVDLSIDLWKKHAAVNWLRLVKNPTDVGENQQGTITAAAGD